MDHRVIPIAGTSCVERLDLAWQPALTQTPRSRARNEFSRPRDAGAIVLRGSIPAKVLPSRPATAPQSRLARHHECASVSAARAKPALLAKAADVQSACRSKFAVAGEGGHRVADGSRGAVAIAS